MLFLKLVIFLLISPAFFVRWVRWLAIFQQKEYRLDRLIAFSKSLQGKRDLAYIFPSRKDFTRMGLKRPVRTNRIYALAFLSLSISSVVVFGAMYAHVVWFVAVLIVLHLLLPVIIFIASLPTSVVMEYLTDQELRVAKAAIRISKPVVVGITGSYGKTSTKILLSYVLAQKYSVFCTPRSFNTRYSVAKSINDSYRGEKIAVLEYGAYNYHEIRDLALIFRPTVSVITGLAPQHLELFGSVENIIKAKSELVRATENKSFVFCNAEDPGTVLICEYGKSKNFIPYTGKDSVVTFQHIGLTKKGRLTFVWRGHTVVTKLVGKHYLSAVAAAIAVAERFALSELEIISALKSFVPPASFVQLKTTRSNALVIDDGGTSNSSGFKAALEMVDWYKKQNYKTILVTAGIVDLGEDSHQIHLRLAHQAEKSVDQVFYLGSSGKQAFKEVFAKIEDRDDEIKSTLKAVPDQTVILIEGRVPSWVYRCLGL